MSAAQALAAALLVPAILAAQPSDWTKVKSLAAGAEVRVEANGTRTQGRLQSTTDESMVVRTKSGDEMIARAQVTLVAEKKRSRRKKHALIGLGIGAAAGGALGGAAV